MSADTTLETIEIVGRTFVVERPEDDEPLVRQAIARGDADPAYWARLWPTALAMATWVRGTPLIAPGVRVLEIGCGLGLVGMAAASRGADVLMTDLDEQGVALARANLRRNNLTARVITYDWNDPAPDDARFDLLLGSDVLYRPADHAPIARLAASLDADAVVALADPNRPAADAARAALENAGLRVWTTAWPGGRLLMAQR